MREYPPRALALMDGLAEELGIWLFPNLRLRNGTDGLEPLAAGYETASLCGCTDLKQPANYHWPNDVAENVDFGTRRRCRAPLRGRDPPPRPSLALTPSLIRSPSLARTASLIRKARPGSDTSPHASAQGPS